MIKQWDYAMKQPFMWKCETFDPITKYPSRK